jgi:DNA-directed RNA polymerase subunit RPC12/RpoP
MVAIAMLATEDVVECTSRRVTKQRDVVVTIGRGSPHPGVKTCSYMSDRRIVKGRATRL